MTWLKVSDRFYSQPVLTALGLEVVGLHVVAMNYCADQLTDGHLTEADVEYMRNLYRLPTAAPLIDKLLSAGRWQRTTTGYEIVGFLDDQPSRQKVMANREATRRRVAAFRNAVTADSDVTPLPPARTRAQTGRVTTKTPKHGAGNQDHATQPAVQQPSTKATAASKKISARDDDDKYSRAAARAAAARLAANARRDLLRRARLHELARRPVKGLLHVVPGA